MAIIVETGAIVPDANSYNSRAEFIAFAALRGVAIPDQDTADSHLVLSTDYLETLDYIGTEVEPGVQPLKFPRYTEDCNGLPLFPYDSIPAGVKKGQLLLALASYQGDLIMGSQGAGPALKRRRTGPMEREYFGAAEAASDALYGRVAGLREVLRPYLIGQGFMQLRVVRA